MKIHIAGAFAGAIAAILLTRTKSGDIVATAQNEDGTVSSVPVSIVESVGETISSVFSKILDFGAGFNVIQLSDGSIIRREGARNWRNNNPGNIEYGSFAITHGAIGSDGRFAVFPTYEAGRAAQSALIFEGASYRHLTLSQAIMRYAPPSENDTAAYKAAILAAVDGKEKRMSEYSYAEREKILSAMERFEGFKVGTVKPVSVT